jgi:hypothetical protein
LRKRELTLPSSRGARAYLAQQQRLIGELALGDRRHAELGAQGRGHVAFRDQTELGDDGSKALIAAVAQASNTLEIGVVELALSDQGRLDALVPACFL